ncbi:MAG: pyridine nucleotide-disulfide oxidoreductase, partial [Pseudomonadota bacterium]
SLTAQAAVRKGKYVAANIIRAQQNRVQKIYTYQALGSFVSMGRADGVGWLGTPLNLVTGLPAFAVKELIEAQYDLFVKGTDTYF